jgi:hypothetical protein
MTACMLTADVVVCCAYSRYGRPHADMCKSDQINI